MFTVIFRSFVVLLLVNGGYSTCPQQSGDKQIFEVAYYWHYVNFTWSSSESYQNAVQTKSYIPENIRFSGIKIYQEYIYITIPRFLPGTPVTLTRFPIKSSKDYPHLQPYPSWDMNVGESCSTLQNVQAVEIDPSGVMWVLDGNRFNNLTKCPPKIWLLDINNNGSVLQTYEVPNELSPHQGGWMNDLVIDESDGGYAYISEVGNPDPGLIIYSRKQNKGWKLRDRSMFQENEARGYVVHGIALNGLYSIDGIALAPASKSKDEDRLVYYTSLTGFSIFALSTKILKNESLTLSSDWRGDVQYVGRRCGATDGMIIDSEGYLYFGLLNKYSIARWNINKKPFKKYVEKLYTNYTTVDWPDSFAFDSNGNLYVTADENERALNTTAHPPPPEGDINMRILKYHTGTNSYLY